MGASRIDHNRVLRLAEHFDKPEIAKRLNISLRSVQRVLSHKSDSSSGSGPTPSLLTPDEELLLMKKYRENGMSFAKIGDRLGMSRQAVEQKLSIKNESIKN